VVKGSFHGRTERPALYSDSSRKTYMQHLASFRGEDSVITVPPYDVDALRQASPMPTPTAGSSRRCSWNR
jgi:hypothetical protein